MKETIIYIRTSTEEQTPELQLKDCETLASKLGLKDYEVVEDKVSGWKDLERDGFDRILQGIKNKQVKQLICWDLDRIYRNRKRLISFFEYCRIYDCKVYSFRQEWLESLNRITPPFNEIMHSLMLQIMGWLAEEESNKKSERTKNAVRREEGITKSYKGNKWGRKPLSQSVIEQIRKLRQEGKSISQICKDVYYWDRNNHQKFVSRAVVHKIISEKSITS